MFNLVIFLGGGSMPDIKFFTTLSFLMFLSSSLALVFSYMAYLDNSPACYFLASISVFGFSFWCCTVLDIIDMVKRVNSR